MLTSGAYIALNDFVIKGCSHSRTSKFYLDINGKSVCDYIADGLIISTPTGSTAYCLSAGGPILNPKLDAIIVTPICPHTLNVRPLVIPASDVVTVKTGDKPLGISIDGIEQDCADKITIKATSFKANLAFLKNDGFYSVLRNKLHWGISPEG
jgi:NAD+ kinase